MQIKPQVTIGGTASKGGILGGAVGSNSPQKSTQGPSGTTNAPTHKGGQRSDDGALNVAGLSELDILPTVREPEVNPSKSQTQRHADALTRNFTF